MEESEPAICSPGCQLGFLVHSGLVSRPEERYRQETVGVRQHEADPRRQHTASFTRMCTWSTRLLPPACACWEPLCVPFSVGGAVLPAARMGRASATIAPEGRGFFSCATLCGEPFRQTQVGKLERLPECGRSQNAAFHRTLLFRLRCGLWGLDPRAASWCLRTYPPRPPSGARQSPSPSLAADRRLARGRCEALRSATSPEHRECEGGQMSWPTQLPSYRGAERL